ncbi:hypothetical protein [Sunxiuqinia rutila]|uniref:hypothetical protein n=1 Tax=Sunxiuqinia rutila TaxID=1397841 RepID=UPI003D36E5C7
MSTSECIQFWSVIITGIGVLVALGAIIWQSNLTRKQMKLNFFSEYTKRYQEIMLNFPENINEPDFSFVSLSTESRKKTLRYMRAYFDLCSEEYYLSKTGDLDKKVWVEWESGIKYAFSKKAFKDGWHLIKLDSQFYGDFVKWVNEEAIK